MDQKDLSSKIKIQVQLPSKTNNHEAPTLILYDGSESGDVKPTVHATLDELFSQISETYKDDTAALHRFSYYLLMQAKEFAQDEFPAQDIASINIVSTE